MVPNQMLVYDKGFFVISDRSSWCVVGEMVERLSHYKTVDTADRTAASLQSALAVSLCTLFVC